MQYSGVKNPESELELGEKGFNEVYKPAKPYTGKAPEKATYQESAMTLIKAYIGSGIMALPYAFWIGGWVLATVIFCFSAALLIRCVFMLIEVADAEKKENYGNHIQYQGLTEFASITYGEQGKTIAKISLISYQIGKSIAYLIFFIQFFKHVLSGAQNEQATGDWIYLILAFCIVIPLGFIDNYALFAKLSLFANSLTMIGLSYIMLYDIHQILVTNALKNNLGNWAHFEQFPMVIGVSIYGAGVLPVAFAIRTPMQDQSEFPRVRSHLNQLFKNISAFVMFVYMFFILLCTWALGDSINQIILFSIGDSPAAYIVQIGYGFGLICSYPLQILPAFQQIERIEKLKQYINPEVKYSSFRRLGTRCLMNITMGFIGFGIPSFAFFINILGAVGGAGLNFVFPILIHLRYFKDQPQKSKYLSYGILAYGICGGTCSLIYSIVKMITTNTGNGH